MKYLFISLLTVIIEMVIAGSWDNSARCPPVLFPNGKVRSRGRGKIIRFNCFEGFTLVGNKYSTCVRGSWDTPTPVCVNSQCMTLPTPEHALVAAKYNGAILMYFCESGYMLIGSGEIYCNGRQWNGTAPYCRDTTAMAPTKCDFENADLCWWEQDPRHDFDWKRHNFETPSSHIGTGPTYDHTLGAGNDGHYLYIEASGRLVNDTARIISPLYNESLTDNGCFSFWYHMYGATIGILRIYMKPELNSLPEIIFEKSGNQGNRWIHGLVDLPKSNVSFQLIIEGVRGSSYVSDLAVDDVAILQGEECNKARKIDAWTTVRNTISDNDQIEIVNAMQSCRGRCNVASGIGILTTTISTILPNVCHCTIDCAENSTCCPDFAEYCVLAVNDTGYSLSTTRKTAESSPSYSYSTQPTIINSKVIPVEPKDDIDPYAAKPPLKISTTKSSKFITNVTTVQNRIIKYSTASGIASITEKIVQAETPFVPKVEIPQITVGSIEASTSINQEYSTEQQVMIEYVPKLHHIVATFGTTEIISIIVVLITGVTIAVAMIIVVLRRRKSYKRGSGSGNGSILSEDSDVRFLTSDEILDFNLARPNDYNEL
ncbi:hypothetical protein PV328_003921 [Microctonus aethiopoides]|uniref:Uncharacterized protein n=1 Tax=Microctonus aethiopoides TaxID=144406 RepID=A0AA39F9M9_9HYME|nr:hypothetical protein PV328_003921 [Microctonus aethiopoides]